MKVLHITGKDYFGAGRAAYRLNKALQGIGVDSIMWVGDKKSSDDSVIQIQKGFVNKWLKKLYVKIEKKQLKVKEPYVMFSNGQWGIKLSRLVKESGADIIHLHWVNRGFIDFADLKNIEIPIVVTMHDMWHFTGGCHYTRECLKYIDTCHSCPQLIDSNRANISTNIQKYKKDIYENISNSTFIGPSTWMKECAKNSKLLQNMKVVNIPNCIDLELFKNNNEHIDELDKCEKKKILIAAVDVLSDLNKGFRYVYEAIRSLPSDEYALVIIGSNGSEQFNDIDMEVFNAGYIDNDRLLINYLSSVDVVVVPSKQENLSNMIVESLACATPVVCFRIGGNDNMVEHKFNGYLAEPYESNDLARGISWCTGNKERLLELGINGRQKVEKTFSPDNVAQEHLELYKEMLVKQ